MHYSMMSEDYFEKPILFVDTSFFSILGLWYQGTWIYYEVQEKKSASIDFHFRIHSVLDQNDLSLNDIKIISCAGPGSYTGMRLSQGLMNVLEIAAYSYQSFYHFEVPIFLGIEKGSWITNAFKKQYYRYSWSQMGKVFEQEILTQEDFQKQKGFYAEGIDVDPSFQTSKLIYCHPQAIFESVLRRKVCRSIFYFRTIQQEFPSMSQGRN